MYTTIIGLLLLRQVYSVLTTRRGVRQGMSGELEYYYDERTLIQGIRQTRGKTMEILGYAAGRVSSKRDKTSLLLKMTVREQYEETDRGYILHS